MNRSLVRLLALAGAAFAIACTFPTPVCGCSPARNAVVVRGTLADSSGVPIPRATIAFALQPATQSPEPAVLYEDPVTTGEGGAFLATLHTAVAPVNLSLVADVVREGSSTRVRWRTGPVSFSRGDARPDTLDVAIRIP